MELLMQTPHGSRLYGLAHANSDNDTFEVWAGRRTRQTVQGSEDVLRVSYDDFLKGVAKGVPQFLEALYSPYKTVDRLDHLDLHPSYWTAVNTYLRTIKSFWLSVGLGPEGFKKRRHSARLAWNLQEFMERGRFNPVLDDEGREWCEQYALGALDYWRL